MRSVVLSRRSRVSFMPLAAAAGAASGTSCALSRSVSVDIAPIIPMRRDHCALSRPLPPSPVPACKEREREREREREAGRGRRGSFGHRRRTKSRPKLMMIAVSICRRRRRCCCHATTFSVSCGGTACIVCACGSESLLAPSVRLSCCLSAVAGHGLLPRTSLPLAPSIEDGGAERRAEWKEGRAGGEREREREGLFKWRRQRQANRERIDLP